MACLLIRSLATLWPVFVLNDSIHEVDLCIIGLILVGSTESHHLCSGWLVVVGPRAVRSRLLGMVMVKGAGCIFYWSARIAFFFYI